MQEKKKHHSLWIGILMLSTLISIGWGALINLKTEGYNSISTISEADTLKIILGGADAIATIDTTTVKQNPRMVRADSLMKEGAAKSNVPKTYEEALAHFKEAYRIYDAIFTDPALEKAKALNAIGRSLYYMYKAEDAINYLKKAETELIKIKYQDSTQMALVKNTLALSYKRLNDYEQAKIQFLEGLDIIKRLEKPDIQTEGIINYGLGSFHSDIGLNEAAIGYFKRAESLFVKLENKKYLARTKILLGVCYMFRGDFTKAELYYMEANQMLDIATNPVNIAWLYNNRGVSQMYQQNYEAAAQLMIEATDIWKQVYGNMPRHEIATSELNIGAIYTMAQNYDFAKLHLDRALDLFRSIIKSEDSFHIGYCHSNMASNYFLQGKYHSAWAEARLALDIYGKVPTEVLPTNKVETLMNMIQIFNALEIFDSSSHYVDLALETLDYDNNKNPFSKLSHSSTLINIKVLEGQMYMKQYKKIGQLDFLEKGIEVLEKTRILALDIKKEYKNVEDKIKYNDAVNELFENLIEAYTLLYENTQEQEWLSKALIVSENNRALRLYNAYAEMQIKKLYKLPSSWLLKEKRLQEELDIAERTLFESKNELEDSIKTALKYLITTKKDSLSELRNAILEQSPKLKQVTDFKSTIVLDEVQQQLRENDRQMLQYFMGDSSLFVFLITADSIHFTRSDNVSKVVEWIYDLRKNVKKQSQLKLQAQEHKTQFAQLSNNLYRTLFEPLAPYIHSQKVTIIPDGAIHYLPFDLLLTAPDTSSGYHALPYLLNDYVIGYYYSILTWAQAQKVNSMEKKARYSLLSTSPGYDTNTMLTDLPYGLEESEYAKDLFDGAILSGHEATKKAFLEQAPSYQYLHISAHAIVDSMDSEYSYIAMAPSLSGEDAGKIYIKDLYSTNLPADVVVLSACETSLGKITRGEGVVSIARGFSFAGAKNIVTSQWSVSDRATMLLMKFFYENIISGDQVGLALRNAKKKYIQSSNRAEPFFWCGFTMIGTDETQFEKRGYGATLCGVLAIGIILTMLCLYLRY